MIEDNDEKTVFMCACNKGHKDVVKYFSFESK